MTPPTPIPPRAVGSAAKRLDEVFGDDLPDTTGDERGPGAVADSPDGWYERNRPPTTARSAGSGTVTSEFRTVVHGGSLDGDTHGVEATQRFDLGGQDGGSRRAGRYGCRRSDGARLPTDISARPASTARSSRSNASTSSPSRRRAARSTQSRGQRRSRVRSPRGSNPRRQRPGRLPGRLPGQRQRYRRQDSRAVFTCRCRRTPRPAVCRSSAAASTSRPARPGRGGEGAQQGLQKKKVVSLNSRAWR